MGTSPLLSSEKSEDCLEEEEEENDEEGTFVRWPGRGNGDTDTFVDGAKEWTDDHEKPEDEGGDASLL